MLLIGFICRVPAQSYRNFLTHDSSQQNSYMTGAVNVLYSQDGKSGPGGKGYSLSVGINVGRFFSKQIVFGATFDLKILNGQWGYKYSQTYKSDFNKSFKINSQSPSDSGRANFMYDLVNTGMDRNNSSGYRPAIDGNTFYEYGIMFSPFPNKFGGFLLKAQRGSYSYRIAGVYGNKYIEGGQADNLYFASDIQYRFELSFKPLAFFRNTCLSNSAYSNFIPHRKIEYEKHKLEFLDALSVSVYYERISYQNSEIDGYKLSSFLNPWFMSKYGIDEYFGVKISFGIY